VASPRHLFSTGILQRLTGAAIASAIALASITGSTTKAEITSNRLMQLYQNPTTQLSTYQTNLSKVFKLNDYLGNRAEYSLISSQPVAKWFADWPSDGDLTKVRRDVANYVGNAWGAGQVPVLVIYNLYKRDCSSASKGGPPAGAGDIPSVNTNEVLAMAYYNQYILQFKLGLQDATANAVTYMPAIILLEPDSLGLQTTATINGTAQKGDKSCADFTQQYASNDPKTPTPPVMFTNDIRNRFLKSAVTQLSSAACYDGSGSCASYDSWIKVYLDGTHSGWGGWSSVADGWLVDALIAAGIQDAAGIFTNVSNYQALGNDPYSTDPHNGELAYGRWLLAKVKAKLGVKYLGANVWGFRPNTCGNPSGFCGVIPEKGQIIDVARNGASISLSKDDDQGNGWAGWCDNIHAQVGPPPTLYPYALTGASWVDALLWVKPAGETDGCFGNGPTNHNIARGVPNPDAIGVEKAGTLDLKASCMLIAGINGVDAQNMPVLNDCNVVKNYTGSIVPHGLRIAATQSVAAGASYDAVMLEWYPVPGACTYQVFGRPKTSGTWTPVFVVGGTIQNGPASSAFIPSWNAINWITGSTVQFSVRSILCSSVTVSKVSSPVTTHDFVE